jgi:hypothetical protein
MNGSAKAKNKYSLPLAGVDVDLLTTCKRMRTSIEARMRSRKEVSLGVQPAQRPRGYGTGGHCTRDHLIEVFSPFILAKDFGTGESRGHRPVAASQAKSAISPRGLPAVVAMLSVAAGRSDLTAIRGDHNSPSTLLGGHSTLKAGVHPCSQSVAKFIQELLDSFKIRNEPLRLCAICRISRIAQASDVVQPVPAIGSSSFRKLQMLQVVAQLVRFRDKELSDCRAPVRRKFAVA